METPINIYIFPGEILCENQAAVHFCCSKTVNMETTIVVDWKIFPRWMAEILSAQKNLGPIGRVCTLSIDIF